MAYLRMYAPKSQVVGCLPVQLNLTAEQPWFDTTVVPTQTAQYDVFVSDGLTINSNTIDSWFSYNRSLVCYSGYEMTQANYSAWPTAYNAHVEFVGGNTI